MLHPHRAATLALGSRMSSIRMLGSRTLAFWALGVWAFTAASAAAASAAATSEAAEGWPQWRGPNRDAKAADFKAPKAWPEKLTQKWKAAVGDGVATPALVDGKLYVFSRQDENEVLRSLDAASGKEIWNESYAARPVGGAARSFSGPRCSPTVADGKVVTLGVEGVLSCHDAATGKVLWRHEEFKGNVPRFATASSPIVVGGQCIAQLGGSQGGGIVAYELATGKEAWKWTGDGAAYGSPVLASVGGTKTIVAPTERSMVALDAASGSLLWRIEYTQGRYNAATPIVDGTTLIVAGPERGMTAERLVEKDGKLAAEELWKNPEHSLQFNTPVLKEGLLFGLSTTDVLFCVDAKDGRTLWSAPVAAATTAAGGGEAGPAPEGGRQGGRGGRGGRGGGGGGRPGFGSVVDAGPVLFALSPAGDLVVFAPSREKLERLATYKVAEGNAHAYPVIAGSGIYIKDGDSVALWTVE